MKYIHIYPTEAGLIQLRDFFIQLGANASDCIIEPITVGRENGFFSFLFDPTNSPDFEVRSRTLRHYSMDGAYEQGYVIYRGQEIAHAHQPLSEVRQVYEALGLQRDEESAAPMETVAARDVSDNRYGLFQTAPTETVASSNVALIDSSPT